MNWYGRYAQQLDLFEDTPEESIEEFQPPQESEMRVSPYNGKNKPFNIFKRNVSGGEKFMGLVYAPSEGQARWKAENMVWVEELDLNRRVGGVTRVGPARELFEKMKEKAEELRKHEEYLKKNEEEQIQNAWWQE